jgi:opacity protein-like surface antigen
MLLTAVMLAVPAVQAAVPYATLEQERRVKSAAPPNGKALIFLYRGEMSGESELPVYLNGRFTGNTASGSFMVWVATPGRYVLSPTPDMAAGVTLRTEAGGSYYVRQDALAKGGSSLAAVSLATGRYSVSSRRLIDLAAAAKQPPAAAKPLPATPAKPRAAAAPRPRTTPPPGRRAGTEAWAVLVRSGSLDLVDESQTLAGVAVGFDMAASGIFGVEGQYRMPSGLTFGAEVLMYEGDMKATTGSSTGVMEVTTMFANVYQYFRPGAELSPYVGVGLGAALASFSGTVVNGDTSGMAKQVLLGVEWKFDSAGVFLEWRRIFAETEDDLGQKANASARGFTAGLGYRF